MKLLKLSRSSKDNFFLFRYLISSFLVVADIVVIQYFRHNVFGTGLLLGWDPPGYVWQARETIAKGPINMAHGWNYPHLYVQLLAFLGCLCGDIITVERILPLLFCASLIFVNTELVLRVSKNIHIAGLAAILTALSINVLRLLADLHRNLLAFLLSTIVILLVSNLNDERSLLNRRYLALVFILLIIASTQFETFFILSISLALYGCLIGNLKKTLMLGLACAIPVAILILLFPAYFLGYVGTVAFFTHEMTFNEIVQWTGGSWILFGFLIIGTIYLFYKTTQRNDKLVPLIFSWFLTIVVVVGLIQITHFLPTEFTWRPLLNAPIPVLLALSVSACNDFFERIHLRRARPCFKKKYSTQGDVLYIKLLCFFLALCLIEGSTLVVLQSCDHFLTPYISHSSYRKILATSDFFAKNGLSKPVVVFRGDPPIWFVSIYRNYLGANLGEHFAYYGEIENLFHLVLSEPKINYSKYLSELERYYLTTYYDELLGNLRRSPPFLFYHESHIKSVETLMSHPIIVVTPEFYNEKIPYYIKSFHVGEGIYVIPPNSSIDTSEVAYGPAVTVFGNGVSAKVKSEYVYIDANNPSIVYLRVSGLSGYESYNFTNFPSYWNFVRIEQDGDSSFPEDNPKRVDGTLATNNNDPAGSTRNWSTPWLEQNGRVSIDTSSKKEGSASLKITGKTDSWGNLGVRYDSPGTWDLTAYSSIAVWAKSSDPARFSITLFDSENRFRTFYAMQTGGEHANAIWKRFVANLNNCTSQTSGFDVRTVDYIDLFVDPILEQSATRVGRNMSFWIDDLTVDTPVDVKESIYKARVLYHETVVVYFYVDTSHEMES